MKEVAGMRWALSTLLSELLVASEATGMKLVRQLIPVRSHRHEISATVDSSRRIASVGIVQASFTLHNKVCVSDGFEVFTAWIAGLLDCV
jgi:hypothetical protein